MRGVLVYHVPEHHECGHRDIVRETASRGHCFFLIVVLRMTLSCVHLDDLLVVFSLLSVASTWGWGKNRHVNTWIHVRLCGNTVSEEKKVYGCFVGLMMKLFDKGKK